MPKDVIKLLEEAKDRYLNGDLSRRGFLKVLGVACASAGLVISPVGRMTRSALATKKTIRFDGWGGVVQEAFTNHAFEPKADELRCISVHTETGGGAGRAHRPAWFGGGRTDIVDDLPLYL